MFVCYLLRRDINVLRNVNTEEVVSVNITATRFQFSTGCADVDLPMADIRWFHVSNERYV